MDVPIAGLFQFGIQGLDGSWILVEPDGMPFYLAQLQPWITTLLGAAVFVSLLAVLITRRILRPLDHLAEAARNFGRTRKPVPISPADLVEVEVIGQAMNKMQERIKRFLDERTHMLAAVSHDLRTGLTRRILDAEELPQGQAKDRIIEGMEEMEQLISATLAFAGDDLKSEPVQKIDLAALLISLCDFFSTGIAPPATAVRIICSPPASRWRSSGLSPTSSITQSSMAAVRAWRSGSPGVRRRFQLPMRGLAFRRTKPSWF